MELSLRLSFRLSLRRTNLLGLRLDLIPREAVLQEPSEDRTVLPRGKGTAFRFRVNDG
jgi:hypothetical protein